MENDKAPKFPNPKLVDRTIGDIQDGLIENLPWLNKAFGKASRLVKLINNKKHYTPNVYVGGHTNNGYIGVSPDSKIGNFCFFYLEDPQYLDSEIIQGTTGNIETNFSLIFWFDLRTIFNEPDNRNTEEVKEQILKLLNGGLWIKSGSIKINSIYENAENIYRGFSIDEVDNQYLMHPYGGFRFSGKMRVFENC